MVLLFEAPNQGSWSSGELWDGLSVNNSDDNVLKVVNITTYNTIYQRIDCVNKITKTLFYYWLFGEAFCAFKPRLTVQIYNMKKRLSRVLVKIFYHIF